jgi:hypothetical protein
MFMDVLNVIRVLEAFHVFIGILDLKVAYETGARKDKRDSIDIKSAIGFW